MTVLRVAQISDTHFLEDGAQAEGGAAYDTDAAWRVVSDDLSDRPLDLVVVTGDIADHGRPAQYAKAAAALSELPVPVNTCPGNHDFIEPWQVHLGRPGVGTSRVMVLGPWAFVFVDSCDGLTVAEPSGLRADPPGQRRLHSNGTLGEREAAWIRRVCEATTAEYVFIWVHHPPGVPVPMSFDQSYSDEWASLVAELANIRGFGAGHTHIPDQYDFEGRPVFVSPSLKNNFSLDPQTWLPPGYRTYAFADDGTVTSDVQLIDDERWPRRPFGRALRSLFNGEITHDELAAIAARKAAQA